MIHEFITCDLCNEDGTIDPELIGGLDDGARFQVSGDEDRARELGWDVDVHPPEHICPECMGPQSGDAAEVIGE